MTEVLYMSCISLIHRSKWQSVYSVHEVQMLLPGRCVSAGTPVRNYGATNVVPTQKDKPLLTSKRPPHFQTNKGSWNKHVRSWVTTRPETKNDCAGKGQQQLHVLDIMAGLLSVLERPSPCRST
jgi:hypothetical protein